MENKSLPQDFYRTGEILIKAVRGFLTEEEFVFPEDTDFKKLYSLAQNHRLVPLIAESVVSSHRAPKEIEQLFKGELFKTISRYNAQEKERAELSAEFSDAGIRHCFLKGYKISQFYPKPEVRFMLDMDVCVEKEMHSRASEIMLSRGYTESTIEGDKDLAFTKKPFLIVELHKEIKYDYDKGYEYYKGAFDRMVRADGCEVSMTNEDFYVYILSHTAHHFETAGTGIKNVVDHYCLNKALLPLCDKELLAKGLEEIGLTLFAKRLDSLCDWWFGEGEADMLIEKMGEFILLSGVFGNETNGYFSGIERGEYSEKKSAYFIHRLFPKLDTMKNRYPILKKLPVLLPLFWLVRIAVGVISPRKFAGEAETINAIDENSRSDHRLFMKNMGF